MAKKTFIVESNRRRTGSRTRFEGTLEELVKSFSYTLEVGKSWEHEKGNSKINCNPKTIGALIKNLNNAKNNAASDGYADIYYEEIIE